MGLHEQTMGDRQNLGKPEPVDWSYKTGFKL